MYAAGFLCGGAYWGTTLLEKSDFFEMLSWRAAPAIAIIDHAHPFGQIAPSDSTPR